MLTRRQVRQDRVAKVHGWVQHVNTATQTVGDVDPRTVEGAVRQAGIAERSIRSVHRTASIVNTSAPKPSTMTLTIGTVR